MENGDHLNQCCIRAVFYHWWDFMKIQSTAQDINMESHAEMIEKALDAYMRNDRLAAFKSLDVAAYQKSNDGKFGKDRPDCSSLLLCSRAMLELVEGLLSGSGDTISACLDVFWEAEKLANDSTYKEAIENRISRGCCYLFGGLLQVFIKSYVKSGVNLTIGYKLIRDFESDVISYKGANESLIRSLGLLVLALLNFFSLILPPTVTSIGDVLGFSVSKSKFSDYIDRCIGENGPYAIIARLIFVYYMINSKSFLFSKSEPSELEVCRAHIDSALARYSDSLAIRVMNASMCLSENNAKGAISTLSDEKLAIALSSSEWSTMALAVNYKLGISYLCVLDFGRARSAFSAAAAAVESTKNSWNYIPFMNCLEGICFLAENHTGKSITATRDTALEIFVHTYIDRDVSTSVILPGDLWGARVGYEYACILSKMSDKELAVFIKELHPMVDILYCMATSLYSFERISPELLTDEILHNLERIKHSKKAKLVLGECYRRKGDWPGAVNAFDDAIEIADHEDAGPDKDNVLAFSLIFQAAALCDDGDVETAQEVMNDLDKTMRAISTNSNDFLVNVLSSFTGKRTGPTVADPAHPLPGNIVSDKGNEFELILNFRRNGIQKRVREETNN
jgi:tetratricopeptide (TPR) repeat protein